LSILSATRNGMGNVAVLFSENLASINDWTAIDFGREEESVMVWYTANGYTDNSGAFVNFTTGTEISDFTAWRITKSPNMTGTGGGEMPVPSTGEVVEM
jgi:hypothetical protein